MLGSTALMQLATPAIKPPPPMAAKTASGFVQPGRLPCCRTCSLVCAQRFAPGAGFPSPPCLALQSHPGHRTGAQKVKPLLLLQFRGMLIGVWYEVTKQHRFATKPLTASTLTCGVVVGITITARVPRRLAASATPCAHGCPPTHRSRHIRAARRSGAPSCYRHRAAKLRTGCWSSRLSSTVLCKRRLRLRAGSNADSVATS